MEIKTFKQLNSRFHKFQWKQRGSSLYYDDKNDIYLIFLRIKILFKLKIYVYSLCLSSIIYV